MPQRTDAQSTLLSAQAKRVTTKPRLQFDLMKKKGQDLRNKLPSTDIFFPQAGSWQLTARTRHLLALIHSPRSRNYWKAELTLLYL